MKAVTPEQRAWIEGLRPTFDHYWEFEWGGVGYIERDMVMWAMWAGIEGAYDRNGVWNGPRVQLIDVSSDPARIVADLDAGDDPEDSWEDGAGHMVCRENAVVCDSEGEPLRYIVEDETDSEIWVTYHATLGDANADAMNQWLSLTPSERRTRHIRVGVDRNCTYCLDRSFFVEDGCWDSQNLPSEDEPLEEITVVTHVRAGGTSLQLNLTRELRELGLDRGDRVEVTLRRI